MQRRLRLERVDHLETRLRATRHRDGHRTIQLHDWRRCQRRERAVEARDARPIGFLGDARARVARRDRGLQRVGAARATELLGPLERRKAAADQQSIPQRTVLIEEHDGLS